MSEQGGDICATAVIDMGTEDAGNALVADLQAWTISVPAAERFLTSAGAKVTMGGCDPGAVDQPLSSVSLDALALPIGVNLTTVNLVEQGIEPRVARCGAFKTVQGFGLAALIGDDLTPEQFRAALRTNLDSCNE